MERIDDMKANLSAIYTTAKDSSVPEAIMKGTKNVGRANRRWINRLTKGRVFKTPTALEK